MNPQFNTSSTSSAVTLMQSIDLSAVDPVIISVRTSQAVPGVNATGYVHPVSDFSYGPKILSRSNLITIPVIGSFVPIGDLNGAQCISDANEMKIIAYISKKSCSSNKRYIYIPQSVNAEGINLCVYVQTEVNEIKRQAIERYKAGKRAPAGTYELGVSYRTCINGKVVTVKRVSSKRIRRKL